MYTCMCEHASMYICMYFENEISTRAAHTEFQVCKHV